tara:strand:+ start:623 stop:1525 length:903 start_codon:yes stop_codon:yes gene_type:complete
MLNISVIILTYNEEKHIERCINNAKQFSNEIFLVDSFSMDKTVEIAESLGAVVVQNKWENNHARQFNWGLDHLSITNEWVFRLDADEYVTDDLVNELKIKFDTIPETVSGIVMERKMIFFDKMMNRGMIKMSMLRLFRRRDGRCEDRWMDEHIVLSSGEIVHFDHVFVDHNLNNLGWWIQKHNTYSIREAIDLLDLELELIPKSNGTDTHNLSTEAESKRKKKLKYVKMPLFLRSFIYFIYRYIFKFGFTEGKIGFLWHFLQGWWYRTLVDAKVYEIKKHCGKDKIKIKAYIKENYHIKL